MVLELALRRTYGKDPLYALLLTFGAAIVIEEAIRAIWGSRERVLADAGRAARSVVIGDLLFARYRFYAAGAAALAIGALWLFIERTSYGAKIKAGSYDSEMIRALGINLTRLRLGVFALGVALGRTCGDRAGADLGRAAAGRCRRRRARVSDHCPRRCRQFLGGGGCRPVGRAWWSD